MRRCVSRLKIPKGTWVERRNLTPTRPSRLPYGQLATCALCFCKFNYREDLEIHLESQLHKDRLKWKEEMEWYHSVGKAKQHQHSQQAWDSFVTDVLVPKAATSGRPLEDMKREARRAVVIGHDDKIRLAIDYPHLKQEIKEPRDQRWPHQKHF